MAIQTHKNLADRMAEIKQQRLNGKLTPKGYYGELLKVLGNLAESLADELDKLEDSEVVSQIPLLVVLLNDQIDVFAGRDH